MIANKGNLRAFYFEIFVVFVYFCFNLYFVSCLENDTVKVISFNTKPVLSEHDDTEDDIAKENFVDIEILNEFGPLENLSYCFRINLRDLFVQCVFSEEDLQFIFMDESTKCGFLYFHGIFYMFQFPSKIQHVAPEEWHHVCVSYQTIFQNKKRAEIKMYLDGMSITQKIINTPPNIDTRFKLRKTWTLGYCKKDDLSNNVRYTRGNITDFNIWAAPLSDNEMKSFTSTWKRNEKLKHRIRPPDVIHWKKMKINKKGQKVDIHHLKQLKKCQKNEVPQIESTLNGINDPTCNEDQNELILTFAKRSTFNEMTMICQQFGGELSLPKQKEDIDTMLSSAGWSQQIGKVCPSIWLPIFEVGKGNSTYRHFKFHKQTKTNELELVEYLNWQFGQPNGQGNDDFTIKYCKLTYL